LVAVAALETLVDVFDEVVVTRVLETVFALLVLEEVDFVDDVEVFVLLVLLVDLRLEDVLVNFWVETEDDVVLFMLLEVALVDF
jgi:hypothetical protein